MLWELGLAAASLAPSASIDDVFQLRSLSEIHLDGRGERAVLVVGRSDLDSNRVESSLWILEVASGRSSPLTHGGYRDERPRWSPDGTRIAFLSSRAGNRSVFVVEAAGGDPIEAVRGPQDVERFAWLPDGSGFLFTMREGAVSRLFRRTPGDLFAAALTPSGEHVDAIDVARGADGRTRVAFTVQPSPEVRDGRLHSDLRILDIDTRETRELVRRPGLDRSPRFSPDGLQVAFVSMGGKADWLANYFLFTVGVDGTGLHNVTEGFDERVEYHVPEGEISFRWSPDGRWLHFLGLRGLDQRVWSAEVRGGAISPASPSDEKKGVTSFDVSPGGDVFGIASDSSTPAEVFSFSRSGTGARPLTSINADYPLAGVGPTERLRYEAKDGLPLEGLLLKPPGAASGKALPLLVVVHGGPMGVFDDGCEPRRGVYPVHAFAAAGYLVFLPNPRGSGGFGESFRKAAVGEWGYADYEDVLRGVDLLVERGFADPERMGVMGWSYGGYMTAWAITQTDRFRAASIGAAITNPYSFWGLTDIPEFVEAYFGGKPWEGHTDYLRHAPEHHVARARTPSLIQHGEADRWVPISQGLSFHRALASQGVEVEMVSYPGEGHEIREPSHVKDAMQMNFAWFERWMSSEKGY